MAQARPITQRMPWLDRRGRFAPLKAATLALLAVPAAVLLYRALFVGLGPRPWTEAIHFVGEWTIYLLLITLAVTPARKLLEWPKLVQLRRMIGLAALFYVLAHLILFVFDSKWDLVFVGREIVTRFYLAIGFIAVLAFSALGVTSTDAMVRRLGGQRWNQLHRLVYPATFIGILHFYLQSKVDVSQPVIMSGFFFWLMGYRIMARFGVREGLVPLLGLTAAAGILTVAVEAAWYGLMTGVGVERILGANLNFAFRISPVWWVLACGLAVTVAAEIRRRTAASPPQAGPSPSPA